MYGRKTVLAISALGPMIAPLLWMIDAWLQPDTDWLVYIAGIALSLTAVGGPAQTAMLADLVTPAERGFCFPVLHAVQKAAPLAAQVIGVAALSLHLQDYTAFWAIMFATQVVIIFVLCTYLPETLPAHKQRPKEWRHLNPLRHYVRITPLKNGGDHSFGSRFGPLRNRPRVFWCRLLDSGRRDGENSEKTEKKRAKLGEIQPSKKSAGRRPICDG